MDTILDMQQDQHKEEETFDSVIGKLREVIKGLQETIPPKHYNKLLDQLDDIKSFFNDLMSQNQELALTNQRLALWNQSITETIWVILIQLPDHSLREALERLHEKTHQSTHDPLPDPYRIMIGL